MISRREKGRLIQTSADIESDTEAQRKLIALIGGEGGVGFVIHPEIVLALPQASMRPLRRGVCPHVRCGR
jgi:hypothetical protein